MTVLYAEPGHIPYPDELEDAAIDVIEQRYAERHAELLAAHTTATRDALAGTDLWAGRRIWNVTTARLEVYTGTVWQPVADLSGHEAASDPHTGYVRKATLTAKGDLYAATASGVIARQAVGANGRVLTADSTQATGLAWTDLSGTFLTKALADAAGDLLVADAADSFARLAKGADGTVLGVSGGTVGWQAPAPTGPTIVYKTADELLASSTTLQNDDHLLVPLAANTSYRFSAVLQAFCGVDTADIKVAFTVPTGAAIAFAGFGLAVTSGFASATNVVTKAAIASGTAVEFGIDAGATARSFILIEGTVDVGATAGDLQTQWAQRVSTANSLIVAEGSRLELEEVA